MQKLDGEALCSVQMTHQQHNTELESETLKYWNNYPWGEIGHVADAPMNTKIHYYTNYKKIE